MQKPQELCRGAHCEQQSPHAAAHGRPGSWQGLMQPLSGRACCNESTFREEQRRIIPHNTDHAGAMTAALPGGANCRSAATLNPRP